MTDLPGEDDPIDTIDVEGGPDLTDEEEFEQMFGVNPEAFFRAVMDSTELASEAEEDYWRERFDSDDLDGFAVAVAKAHPNSANDIAQRIYGLGMYLRDDGWPEEGDSAESPIDNEGPGKGGS